MPDAFDASARPSEPLGVTLSDSPAARQRLAELRGRFVVRPAPSPVPLDRRPHPALAARPVFARGVATAFDPTEDAHLRAVLPDGLKRAVLRSATALLPRRANDAARLEDDTTHVAVRFALRGASDAQAEPSDGLVIYRGALAGSDVVHRVHAEGTEDYVVFEERPAREELAYDVDVSRAAGLRLVSNVLEFLDEGGAPRLRMAPPYVVDAGGAAHKATIAVDGCAYDTDASGPWGRKVTRAGADRCTVRVAWEGVAYPAVVDPAWTATGSMTVGRQGHTATLLKSGRVLVAGGGDASAELYDGQSSFAATGSMTVARGDHTATLLPSGKVLIAGGFHSASAEIFDGTSSFAYVASMASPREAHTATLLESGKVLIAGGYQYEGTTSRALASAELFDANLSSFVPVGPMSFRRAAHSATLLNSGRVLVAGGNATTGLGLEDTASAELFDGTSTFTPTGSMTTERRSHSATLLPSGKVLITGGVAAMYDTRSSAELFDGASTFTAVGPMANARANHTATLLPSGKVLVAGGDDYDCQSAELFDGASGYVATPWMLVGRRFHTATLLPSGKVLIAGGATDGAPNAELYQLVAPGGTCIDQRDCASAICNKGVCCQAACGPCTACASGSGACVPVTNADDPDTCTGASTCDAAGACKKKNGQPAANGSECASGFAADGVCCNAACDSGCDVCSAALGASADGTCTLLPAGVSGSMCAPYLCTGSSPTCPTTCTTDAACASGFYCSAAGQCAAQKPQGAACDLTAAADCKQPGCGACASGNCIDGVCCDSSCGGACDACSTAAGAPTDGTCAPVAATEFGSPDCAPYRCSGTSGACATSCTSDAQCGLGYGCTSGKCIPVGGSFCKDARTSVDPKGNETPCAPYRCASGTCSKSCESVDDCLAPSVCVDRVCTASSDGSAVSDDGGCGCRVGGGGSHGAGGAALAMLAGVAVARRRRRAST